MIKLKKILPVMVGTAKESSNEENDSSTYKYPAL